MNEMPEYKEHPEFENDSEIPGQSAQMQSQQPIQVKIHLPKRKAIITYAIFGLTILFYIFQSLSQTLLGFDLPSSLLIKTNQAISQGQFWRLITPVLLHGSILHIAFNMYALYVIGPVLERFYGHTRFLLIYLLGGFVGNVFSFMLTPLNSLGASTAVFGLVAAQAVFIYNNRFLFGNQARITLINIAGIVIVNLILGLNPGIDNWGHIGGLLGGLAYAWFAGPILRITGTPPDVDLRDLQKTNKRTWLTALLLVLLFGFVVVIKILN